MESHLRDTPLLRNEPQESWWPKRSQPMSLDPVLLRWDIWGLPGLSHSFAKLCRAQQALKIYAPNTSLSPCCSGQPTEGKNCSVQAQLRCMQGSPLLLWDYRIKWRKGYTPYSSYERIPIFTDRCCPL